MSEDCAGQSVDCATLTDIILYSISGYAIIILDVYYV